MKRVLFLGASATQVPAIRYARDQGYHVITADYLPENPGHAIAHESYDVSTVDRHKVLELARRLHIDGIVAFASEPAAPTAAFVSEKLGLPGNSYDSVMTLSSKDRYRDFLATHGFACPAHHAFTTLDELRAAVGALSLPVVVKPTDNSGSKGVSVLHSIEDLAIAFDHAMSFSRAGRGIVEEFVGQMGEQIIGEGFIWGGELIASCFARHRFNASLNGLVPIGGDFPYADGGTTQRIRSTVNRLLDALGFRMGATNMEFRLGPEGEIYPMEIAARNGGNMLPQLATHATGFDMVGNTVDVALGRECQIPESPGMRGFYSYYVLHARKQGRLKRLEFSRHLEQRIRESNIWTRPGDEVRAFTGANCSLGVLVLSFDSAEHMHDVMDDVDRHVAVEVE